MNDDPQKLESSSASSARSAESAEPRSAPSGESPLEGAPFPGHSASETRPSAATGSPLPSDHPAEPVTPRVWTAADAPAVDARPGGSGIRAGQLVWACVVGLVGVFLIALPYLDAVNLPILLIALVALLGLALIGAALAVGRAPDEAGNERD